MSEAGEIPAEPSRNGDDEGDKQDEVLASAVAIDDNDEDGSDDNDAVAAVCVEDDPTTAAAVADEAAATAEEGTTGEALKEAKPAAEAPTKKEEDDEEEDGEVVETADDIKKASDEKDKNAATETPVADSNEKKDEKDSQVSSSVDKPAEEEDAKMADASKPTDVKEEEEDGEVIEPTEASKKETDDEKMVSTSNNTNSDSIVAATTEDNKPKEVEAEPEPTKKEDVGDDDEEEGEVNEDEAEEGEIEDPAPENEVTTKTSDTTSDKPAEVKKDESGEDKEMAIESTEKEGTGDMPPAEKEETLEESPEAKDDNVPDDDVKDKEMEPVDEEKASTSDPEKTDTTAEETKEKADSDVDDEAASAEAEDKPTPMEVEKEELKVKVSESSSEIKKNDDDDDEDGEIHEDDGEEGELKETEEESDAKSKDVDTEEEGEINENEDADMDDALSQSEDGAGDRDAEMALADADTASTVDDTADDTASIADDADEKASKKAEPTYSTRRSASGTTTPVPRDTSKSVKSASLTAASAASASGSNEQWQRSVREALEGLGRGGKESTPAGVGPGGASFLEALGEDERRTRTRFLPAVDGIHMLRKNEIKGDLALARSIMSNAGSVADVASVAAGASGTSTSKKSKKKKQDSGEDDAMDTEDADAMSSSEEDPVGNASTIEVDDGDLLVVPSGVFVPPPAATHSSAPTSSNGEKEDGAPPPPASSTGVKGILNNQRNIKSPRVVESVTAFNPPRPPESVGKKKQHRMLRWERRPADVELDLNSYRKTVDRTRKELHTEEAELERIEATSNHLRRHFLNHLRCMDQEMDNIMGELNSVQQKCVNAADLLTSRTRSRGAGKGSYVMKDVLTVLKARGEQLDEKGLSIRDDFLGTKEMAQNYPGLGGVGGSSFADWNHLSTFPESAIASAWVLPGDKVQTPAGEGVVTDISDSTISVRLPFGIGHFNPASVTSKECANTLTDAALAKRWRAIIDTAVSHSGLLDLNGMESVESTKPKPNEAKSQHDASGEDSPANGGTAEDEDMDGPEHHKENTSADETKLLPFGSSLLPTGTGRGDKLCEMNALQLQNEFKAVLADGAGVLGDKANEGVTSEVKEFEESVQESYILQARVFHLRNQLYRQRRIRTLNERTFSATGDKSVRVEGLVSEMRTDLKSLKYRLDEELKELGIDQDRADEILKAYYLSQDDDEHELDEDDHHTSPASKRSRDDDGQVSDTEKTSGNGVADEDMERHTKRLKVASH